MHGTTVVVSVGAAVPPVEGLEAADGMAPRERVATALPVAVAEAVLVDDAVEVAELVAVLVALPATGPGEAEGDANVVYAGIPLATRTEMALMPDTYAPLTVADSTLFVCSPAQPMHWDPDVANWRRSFGVLPIAWNE